MNTLIRTTAFALAIAAALPAQADSTTLAWNRIALESVERSKVAAFAAQRHPQMLANWSGNANGRSEQAAADAAGLRDVFFGYDSFAISEEGRQALARNAEWIKSNPGSQLKIEGHCDERGTSAYNLVLGEKRAKAARNYLVELGVSANRLGVVSYGKERPFCKDHSEACYAQNRRGHVVVKSGK